MDAEAGNSEQLSHQYESDVNLQSLPRGYKEVSFETIPKIEREITAVYKRSGNRYLLIRDIPLTSFEALIDRKNSPSFHSDYFPRWNIGVVPPSTLYNRTVRLFRGLSDKKLCRWESTIWMTTTTVVE